MAETPTVVISFREITADEKVREIVEKRCGELADEFPETTRFEVTLSPDGNGSAVHARAAGRNTEVEAHAEANELRASADQALDKLERQLRRVHDKRIFSRRREAQKASPKNQA